MIRSSSAWSAVDRVTIAATALAILAVAPRDWLANLGAWTRLATTAQPFLGLVALVLVGGQMVVARHRLDLVRHRRRPERLLISPDSLDLRRLLDVVRNLLDQLGRSKEVPEHRVRMVLLTGRSMVDTLFDILKSQRPPGRWRLEILVMSPRSPVVAMLEHRTPHDVEASLCRLVELQEMAREESWPYDIEYRMYDAAPTMRGFLLDDRHLFLGYTAWSGDRLTTQGRHLLHVQGGTAATDLEIEWFMSWFDRVFDHARRPDDER
jgi:hypothetical protein